MALKNNELALTHEVIEDVEAEELETSEHDLEEALENIGTKAGRIDFIAQKLYRERLIKVEFDIMYAERLQQLRNITRADYELYHTFFCNPQMPLGPGNVRTLAARGIKKPTLLNERIRLELRALLINHRITLYEHRLEFTKTESEGSIQRQTQGGLSDFFTTPRLTFCDFESLLQSAGITVRGRIRKSGIGAKALAVSEVLEKKCLLAPKQAAAFREAFTQHYCGAPLSRSAYTNARLSNKGNLETYQNAFLAAYSALKK